MQGLPRQFRYPQRNYRHPQHNLWTARPPAEMRPRAFRPLPNYNSNYGQSNPTIGFESQEHWCETCDRGFPTETLLNNHQKQHQKCNIDGCQFIAHPKIITKHIQMQHSTGLYKKIANLNNPDEIQKWREERKKKYPTKANIEKKMAASKEKIERGEKMGLDRRNNRHQFNNNRNYNQGQKRRHNGIENQPRFKQTKFNDNKHNADNEIRNGTKDNTEKTNKNDTTETKKPQDKRKSYKILPEVENKRQLKPFTGISSIIEDPIADDTSEYNDLIEDDVDDIHEMVAENKEPAICSALSSLLCDYGSSDEDDDEENTMQSINKPNRKVVGKTYEHVIQNTANSSLILEVSKSIPTPDVSEPIPNELTGTTQVKCTESKQKENIDNKLIEVKVNKTEISNKVEENEISEESKLIPNEPMDTTAIKDSESKVQSDDDSGPEEVKLDKTEIPNSVEEIKQNKTINKKTEFVRKNHFRRPKSRLPSTLLQKLLSREMQHERNVVLQCVRYIKKNNYFDKSNV